jgi:hypothetical protein
MAMKAETSKSRWRTKRCPSRSRTSKKTMETRNRWGSGRIRQAGKAETKNKTKEINK